MLALGVTTTYILMNSEVIMKKTIAIILTIFSLILILDSMNAGQAVAMFLLAGIIPGTNFVVSASQMLQLFALLIGFVLARVSTGLVKTYVSYRKEAKLSGSKSVA
jgi:hypothetical protein